MRHLAQRVARLYTAKIPVPPRRGPRGKTVFLNALIAKLQKTIPPFAAASQDLQALRPWGDMFESADVPLPDLMSAGSKAPSTLRVLQDSAAAMLLAARASSPEYWEAWNEVPKAILNHPLQGKVFDTLYDLVVRGIAPQGPDPRVKELVQAVKDLQNINPRDIDRDAAAAFFKMFRKLGEDDLTGYFLDVWTEFDNPEAMAELLGRDRWRLEVADAVQRAEDLRAKHAATWDFQSLDAEAQAIARTYAAQANALRNILEDAKARLEVYKQEGQKTLQHPAIERYETLYHASISAKKLFQDGFAEEVPAQAGLGGSQDAGKGKKGTSFTYDLYVAKEVARSLKEMAMIAKGALKGREIYDWARRDGVLEDLSRFDVIDGPYAIVKQKGDWALVGRDGQTVSPDKVFDTPLKTAELYRGYLNVMGFKGKRYDSNFLSLSRVLPVLARANLKDVGIVAATVDMSHPDIYHAGGERELRVPPEAIVSADRFIPG